MNKHENQKCWTTLKVIYTFVICDLLPPDFPPPPHTPFLFFVDVMSVSLMPTPSEE